MTAGSASGPFGADLGGIACEEVTDSGVILTSCCFKMADVAFCFIRFLPTRTAWCVSAPSFLMATPFATTLRPTTSTFPSLPSTAAKRRTQRNLLSRWRTPCVGSRSCCSRACSACLTLTLKRLHFLETKLDAEAYRSVFFETFCFSKEKLSSHMLESTWCIRSQQTLAWHSVNLNKPHRNKRKACRSCLHSCQKPWRAAFSPPMKTHGSYCTFAKCVWKPLIL